MSLCLIASLPEELLLNIFEYLDSISPSELRSRQEPNLGLIKSTKHPLKDTSCVSKRWRRVVLPLLFNNTCLRLDIPWRSEWSSCQMCGTTFANRVDTVPYPVDMYHLDLMDHYKERRTPLTNCLSMLNPRANMTTTGATHERPDEYSTALWAARFYHTLHDFIKFINKHHLASPVRSFLLMSGRMLDRTFGLDPSGPEWRYPAAAALWHHLLSVIDPDRVVILAPPTELACLANAAIDASGDWAFDDMEYQMFELRQDPVRTTRLTNAVDYNTLIPFPSVVSSFAHSSVINLRHWTHIGLNEGSFLKAYGTYEFFERGPPSLVCSINQCLAPSPYHRSMFTRGQSLSALRSFTYTAIFPFANHARFAAILPYLEEIDLQFAPDPQSRILDDKVRTGKADLTDCWRELFFAYNDIAKRVSTHKINGRNFPRLKSLTVRDYRTQNFQNELDEIFTKLCLPVWVERAPGYFTREAVEAPVLDIDELE